MNGSFDGFALTLGSLPRLSHARSRSICPENPTGEKGRGAMAPADPAGPARDLGRGWKCRPCLPVRGGETLVLADIEGPGCIQSFWITGTVVSRDHILRIYWDGQEQPSVEVPLPDFFATHWPTPDPSRPTVGPFFPVNSLPVCVNPARGLNCFWPMPFRKSCRVTLEARGPAGTESWCYYQLNYSLAEVPQDAAYFHAQFRRTNPTIPLQDFVILDGVRGRGHYAGVSMGWGVNNSGWWGEGEIKFFIDGDDEFPTICGTGTEDYFGGAYNWEVDGEYRIYSTPFMGMHQVLKPDGAYRSQHRHAMYRWHVMDPVRFESDLRVTIQALGWRSEGRYYPGEHDICSTAFWYQELPTAPFPTLGDRDALEIV